MYLYSLYTVSSSLLNLHKQKLPHLHVSISGEISLSMLAITLKQEGKKKSFLPYSFTPWPTQTFEQEHNHGIYCSSKWNVSINVLWCFIAHSVESFSFEINFRVTNVILALNQSNLQTAWFGIMSSLFVVVQCPLQKCLKLFDISVSQNLFSNPLGSSNTIKLWTTI